MNVAVLLVYCNDNPRETEFTRDWAEKAVKVVGDYIAAQSAGRVALRWRVMDWLKLDMTAAQWVAMSGQGIAAVLPAMEAQLGGVADLDGYDHYLVGVDLPDASGGTTPGNYTYLAARDFNPSSIGHEFGHRFGAVDAFGETAAGPVRYLNRFCVMGFTPSPATFNEPTLITQHQYGLDHTGPNMCAPTLMATGWLDGAQHALALDLTGTDLTHNAGRVENLSALAGAPPVGAMWTRPPLVIRYEDLLVEYRVGAPGGWDRGLPDPGTSAYGWVVVHRSPPGGQMVANHVKSIGAEPGASLVLGQDNLMDILHPGPLIVTVLMPNAADNTVRLVFFRRAAHVPAVAGRTFGAVTVDGGGWLWTPSGGLRRLPPHSPLLDVLHLVGMVQSLYAVSVHASADELAAISQQTARMLSALHETVARLPVEAARSPMEQVLDGLASLEEAVQRFDERRNEPGVAAEFLDVSRRDLARLRQLVDDAARAE